MKKHIRKLLLDRLEEKALPFAEEVARLFRHMNWTWGGSKTPPTQQEILDELHEMLDRLHDNKKLQWVGGGRIYMGINSEGDGFMRVAIEEFSYYDEEDL